MKTKLKKQKHSCKIHRACSYRTKQEINHQGILESERKIFCYCCSRVPIARTWHLSMTETVVDIRVGWCLLTRVKGGQNGSWKRRRMESAAEWVENMNSQWGIRMSLPRQTDCATLHCKSDAHDQSQVTTSISIVSPVNSIERLRCETLDCYCVS